MYCFSIMEYVCGVLPLREAFKIVSSLIDSFKEKKCPFNH